MVRFTIELPGNIDSRTISDGLKANKLTVAVYDDQGNELPDIRVNKDIPHQTTVEFKLVKGQKYSFAFWAQADGAPYNFDTANKTVSVSYTDAKSNDETRDAFYAYRADLTVTGPMSETIYLKRPFCQLNYGASDYQDAIKAGVNATKSAVTVNHAATSFDLATGATDGDQAVTFTQEILPNDPATLAVEDKTYQWMAMNYFLVPNNEATIETSLALYEDGNETAVRDITVPNVPVEKNHRTNIVGNLFTEDVNFLVIIDERFDQPDYIRDLNRPEVTDGKLMVNGVEFDDLATAIAAANGNIVYMGKGTYDTQITVGDGQTVKLAAGKGLNRDEVVINKQIKATAGATLELDGITVHGNNSSEAGIDAEGATVKLNAVTSTGNRGMNIFGNCNVTIENCEFSASGTYARGLNIGKGNNTVTVKRSKISAPTYYALNFIGSADNETVTLTDCDIEGWAVINMWGKNCNITADGCKFTSINKYSGNSNAFSAINYSDENVSNNTLAITHSTIYVEAKGDQPQWLMIVRGTGNKFIGNNIGVKGVRTLLPADSAIYDGGTDTDWSEFDYNTILFDWSEN